MEQFDLTTLADKSLAFILLISGVYSLAIVARTSNSFLTIESFKQSVMHALEKMGIAHE